MHGRSIGRDLVTGVFQTTFYRRSERRIVIDDMHKPRQGGPLTRYSSYYCILPEFKVRESRKFSRTIPGPGGSTCKCNEVERPDISKATYR
jgi:hypothetical protein